jgi:hypothetical protein
MHSSALINQYAKRIHMAFQKENATAADVVIREIAEKHGQELLLAVLDEVKNICRFAEEEAAAECERVRRENAEIDSICSGMPRDMSFAEACRIKAAQANVAAQRWLQYWDSRAFRLGDALLTAALERHPGWISHGNGHCTQTKGAPDEEELVEWLYKNYPLVARDIERRFPPEARP